MNKYQTHTGFLDVNSPARRGGKKILAWEFRARGCDESVPVDVYLIKWRSGLTFQATSKRLPSAILDTDIESLRKKVESTLLDQTSSIVGITWEDWLEIVVKGDNTEMSGDLRVEINRMKRGIHPKTGNAVTINHNGIVVNFPVATTIRAPKVRDRDSQIQLHDNPCERAYIPETPENLRALKDILGRMEQLRSRLAQMLSLDSIVESLSDLNACLPLMLTDESQNHKPRE